MYRLIVLGIYFFTMSATYANTFIPFFSFIEPVKSGLVPAEDHVFYGHTDTSIFRLVENGKNSSLTKIQESYEDGKNSYYFYEGELTLNNDKQFIYGVRNSFTRGEVFKIDTKGNTIQILHTADIDNFNQGYDLLGGVVLSKDEHYLYGATVSGGQPGQWRDSSGVIYQVTLNNSLNPNYRILHQFKADLALGGVRPASLILSKDSNSLYGITTQSSSLHGEGMVFRLNAIHSNKPIFEPIFRKTGIVPKQILLSADNKLLYGIGWTRFKKHDLIFPAILFKTDLTKKDHPTTILYEFTLNDKLFGAPQNIALSKDGKTLYGTTGIGEKGSSTVFKLDLTHSQSNPVALHLFTDYLADSEGRRPRYLLYVNDDAVIGVTEFGGIYGSGLAYSLNAKS